MSGVLTSSKWSQIRVRYLKSRLRNIWNVMELRSRSILCRKTGLNPGSCDQQGCWQIRNEAFWRELETQSLWRSVIKHRETRRDGTDRTTCTVLIFVTPTLPINQRKWNDIPVVRRVDDYLHKISKLMTWLLRYQGYPREDDGAMEWNKWLPMLYHDHPDVKWTKQTWLNNLEKGSKK